MDDEVLEVGMVATLFDLFVVENAIGERLLAGLPPLLLVVVLDSLPEGIDDTECWEHLDSGLESVLILGMETGTTVGDVI